MSDVNPIIRQMQIDIVIDKPNRIITWFNDLCCRLKSCDMEFDNDEYNGKLYYIDKDVLFHIDKQYIWCNCEDFWEIINIMLKEDYNDLYTISYIEIQDVIRFLFEARFNKHMGMPYVFENGKDYDYIQRKLQTYLLSVEYDTN